MIDLDMLKHIPPDCNYDEWLKVGMALKHEGIDFNVWDQWSSGGTKYKRGECEKKWRSFHRNDVTGGTLYHIAYEYGYRPEEDASHYDISNLLLDECPVDPAFVSTERVPQVSDNYNPIGELTEYIETLFEPDDYIGYCVSFTPDGKPGKTEYRRQAKHILEELKKKDATMKSVFLSVNEERGAYIRFNPLDGHGENNANVTRWTHCLVESDTDSIDRQYSLFKAMNLPITFLVNSGGKSLHAIVRVDAANAQQYRQRVREIYDFCKKSGMTPDEQDKNESRFSRMPGMKRGGRWQYIVERHIGAKSYADWIRWREEEADDLPPDTNLDEVWDHLPPLKDELIPGILRVGHKMLLAGPSKAGKSFLLINLAISIAEGAEWLGLSCRQGRVCYVNLELDEASCLHRFKEIYDKRGLEPSSLNNIDIWNLRGHAVPMNKLAPVMIHRFKDRGYVAVIIDPIYKVITGDENNATEMSQFCSYFDKVAAEMSVSVVYCHHHSKGAAGKYANAADRSSGSGVFARDPDAIIDLRELSTKGLTEKYRAAHEDACDVLTAWEMSCTLREFAPPEPRRIWFDYPVHVPDDQNYLAIANFSDSGETGRGTGRNQTSRDDWFDIVEDLLDVTQGDTAVSLEQVGISESNAKRKFAKETDYEVASIDGVKVVHKRSEDMITYLGNDYIRKRLGNRCEWPSYELQNLI